MTTPNQQLSEEDLSTYERRRNRAEKQFKKGEQEISRNIEDTKDFYFNDNEDFDFKDNEDFDFNFEAFSVENLERLVADRPQSNAAKALLECARCMKRGIDALKRDDKKLAASNLSEALRRSQNTFYAFYYSIERKVFMDVIMTSMKSLFSDTSQDNQTRAEALCVHAILLRYSMQPQKALSQYRLAQILLPQDPFILVLLRREKDYNGALKASQKAAKLFGDDEPEITLFYPAWSLLLDLNNQCTPVAHASYVAQATSLFEKYVQCAEPDALKLPSALYYLASIHGLQGPSSIGKARRHLAMAEEAEKIGLPFDQYQCHLNAELQQVREVVRTLLKKYIACGNEKCSAPAEHPCSKCEQVCYCSQECLNADWPSHKAFCKKNRKGKDKKASKN